MSIRASGASGLPLFGTNRAQLSHGDEIASLQRFQIDASREAEHQILDVKSMMMKSSLASALCVGCNHPQGPRWLPLSRLTVPREDLHLIIASRRSASSLLSFSQPSVRCGSSQCPPRLKSTTSQGNRKADLL